MAGEIKERDHKSVCMVDEQGIGGIKMKNTVLITGGNSGIGLALAIRYLKDGNTVII